jgi:amidase
VAKCPSNEIPNLYNASIDELQKGLSNGYFTSVDLVKAYIARINEVNLQGPTLRAVIEISPTALQAASTSDALRKKGTVLSSLHGIPILLKDNIATRPVDGMNTTAGSFALLGSITPGDATVAEKLRNAGAILLGKTALSEWANFRGTSIPNGWSGRGGQATNAFYRQGDACGSSSGSGIAASIGLAAGTLGTETDGSIICPSNRNNVVGIKPTVGLTSRNLVIPLSQNQDSIGPMCQSVADAAAILTIIAGPDSADNFTLSQPTNVPNYTQHLKKDGLKGARIGVLRKVFANSTFGSYPDYIVSEFNKTIEETFKKLGAIIVDPADLETADEIASADNELIVFKFDLKYGINQYLSQLKNIPSNTTTLQGLIDYNIAHSNLELPSGRDNQYW